MAYPSQAVVLIVVSSVFPALSITAVCLRIYARRLKGTKLDWSDYTIFFTLLLALLNAIDCIIGAVACGIGRSLSELSPKLQVRFLKVLFASQFFYIFTVWSVKVSVLLFYKKAFDTPGFRRWVNGTLWFLFAWVIAFFFVTLFQDKPIRRNWEGEGTTINWQIFYLVLIASDVALDIFILCLPLPVIYRLKISRKKKWLISWIFWVGAVIVVASTVRLYYMVKVRQEFRDNNNNFSITTVNTIIWGSIEPCTSVIAACLPVLGPIIFIKRRQAEVKAAKFGGLSSYLRKMGPKDFKEPVVGDVSRALGSIDKLNSRAGDFSMASIAPRDSGTELEREGAHVCETV
ncbi:hypothetical protein K458DRAFT_381883 [Lentithecium fluviatile CBS 122367]|uniref:Rhodopsin domain-containing protein n=1 Tax=Lentithecium fluviatile CBS 122367 TaxID=1168545 RepID=A0A6G1JNJ1_9PLEO|nr:hypothetical protein K458DRAFT_381883 [Lentithecium fluviatile CBS 122367]